MTRSAWSIAFVCLAAGIGCGFWLFRDKTPPPDPCPDPSDVIIQRLEIRAGTGEGELSQIARQLGRQLVIDPDLTDGPNPTQVVEPLILKHVSGEAVLKVMRVRYHEVPIFVEGRTLHVRAWKASDVKSRVYDCGPALRQARMFSREAAVQSGCGVSGAGSEKHAAEQLVQAIEAVLRTSCYGDPDPIVKLAGARLVVVGSEDAHAEIKHVLEALGLEGENSGRMP
ncbi:MAG: hypothetical protein ACHRHE_20655 [Tepidisphaerales bacterium]